MKLSISTISTLIITMALASVCKADGFFCRVADGNLTVKVFDHVHSSEGTRSAAYMVVSNPLSVPGFRTLAVFSSEQGTLQLLTHQGAYLTYAGKVDLRFNNIRKSRAVLAESMTNLAAVQLHIYFNYQDSHVTDGSAITGVVDLVERSGHHVYSEASCIRYLKGATP